MGRLAPKMSKRELKLAALFCELPASLFGLLKVDQRFRHQPDGAICVKTGADTWRPITINCLSMLRTGVSDWKIYPYHKIEDLMADDKKYNRHTNWATWNVLLWIVNVEGTYLQMVANRPYTARTAEEFAVDVFPVGTPDMINRQAGEMANVDWDEVAEALNEE